MSALQATIFLLTVVAVIAALVVIKKRNSSARGFKDFVKNPEYWEGADHAQQEVDAAVEAAKGWSDEKIASLTRHFVLEATSSREAWDHARILRELGERTHPTVLGLLRDSSLYNRLVKPSGKDILPEAPFNRACELLGNAPPAAGVEALSAFLNDPADGIRKDAALAIAKTGAASIGPLVKQAFSDTDEYVRSYALMGLGFLLKRSGLAANLREELFPAVLALLREGKNADNAADILYSLDAERAKEFFLSPEEFTADSRILHELLETLANARVPVPRERLHGLIASLEAKEMKYPWTYALGEALRLLGQQQREEDRDFLRARTTHREERVAQGAAAGLLCSFGVEGFERTISDTVKNSGDEGLSPHQKLYCAVSICDAEINNGGLAHYFVNSSGNHWREAVAGFTAMGFKERLAVLNEAASMFGTEGPSTDRDVRQNQLSKLYKRNDAIFKTLESRYYNSSEVVEVFTARFVLENPEGFR